MPEYFVRMAFDELLESRQICIELEKVKKVKELQSNRAEQRDSRDVDPSPNPSEADPETQCAKDQGQALPKSKDNTDVPPANSSHLNPKKDHRLWPTVYDRWRKVSPCELERGFYIEMGGYELVSALDPEVPLPDGFEGRVTPRGAIELARNDLLPEVTTELINDQSKSDILTKVLVCLQAGWMIIQCIARFHQSLPLTLLEVHTLMHAIFAFFMYCLWFRKPQDVMVTTKIMVDSKTLETLKGIKAKLSSGFKFTEPQAGSRAVTRSTGQVLQANSRTNPMNRSVMTYFAYPIYGGAHLAVWNAHFPSNFERILWLASALSIAVLPPLGDVLKQSLFCIFAVFSLCCQTQSALFSSSSEDTAGSLSEIGKIGVKIGTPLWVLARAYLLVEAFASLRSLPLGSYKSIDWVSYLPHM